MDAGILRLKPNEERRLRRGHLWVFSNEVDTARSPLTAFEPGAPVRIVDSRGRPLGCGYVNPHSLISARLVSRNPAAALDRTLLGVRLRSALSLRDGLFDRPCYRLVYGESDGLPGLVVDRYGDTLVVQITTAGMERLREDIVTVLQKLLDPAHVVLRNDSPLRELEGLPRYVETAVGTTPDTVAVEENGTRFETSVLGGQKTGWYYDHRMNRQRAQAYVHGRRVLDLFSYVGAWGVQSAVAGAREVTCVDSSEAALDQARRNAALNGVEGRVRSVRGDAFEVLKALRAEREHFDVIILDPPAFIKRKKDRKQGEAGYQRLNQLAMQVLARDGILISASCSYHLPAADLQEILLRTSRHLDRGLQILEQGHQGPDHPVHPAIAETAYLKAFFCRVPPS